MHLEYVEWLDSHSTSDGAWHTAREIGRHPMKIRSIGWVLRETKRSLTLVAHLASEQFSGDMVIPKVAIVKRKKIKL